MATLKKHRDYSLAAMVAMAAASIGLYSTSDEPAAPAVVSAPAAKSPVRPPAPAVNPVAAASCRIAVNVKQCTRQGCGVFTSWGTGTLIAPGRVLTCSHLFNDGNDETVVYFGGKPYVAKLLKRDKAADLALLAVDGVNVKPTGWVDVVNPADRFVLCGFGPGEFRQTSARFVAWWDSPGRHSFSVDADGRDGDSGGGAFNSAGQLVAVRWGAVGGHTFVSGGEPLVKFLWGK